MAVGARGERTARSASDNLKGMRTGPPPALEIATYALVALGAAAGALLRPGHVIGDGVDMFGTFWFYWWILDCIQHLRDPSFTQLMFYPLGKDIFAHTGNNFVDALFAAPVQAIFGFPRYQPVWVALLLFGNALTFRPLAIARLGRGWASWGATLLWTTNPYVLFECMTGRFTQAMLWFLPGAVLAFLRAGERVQAGERPWGQAALAGLLTALQAWTYWFMGYFMALGFAWLAAVDLWRSRARGRLIAAWALAGAVCLGAVGPALWAMRARAAAGRVPGLVGGTQGVLGNPGKLDNNVGADLHSYRLMETTGQPMFGTWVWGLGALALILWGRDRARWLGVALLGLLFALGPALPDVFGQRLVMPHYLLAYNVLPFFDRLWFPYRLLSVVFLAVTVGLGTVLARLEGRLGPRAGLAIGALALANLVEQNGNLAYPILHREFRPPALYSWIREEEGALIELPIGLSRVSVAWQPVHQQPTWGGMGENAKILWPPGFEKKAKNSFIRFLSTSTRDPAAAAAMKPLERDRAGMIEEGFRWVVLDRQLVDAEARRAARALGPERVDAESLVFRTTDALIEKLGPPTAVDGGLLAWDLWGRAKAPDALSVEEAALRTRIWPEEKPPAYEENLRRLGRLDQDGG